jgi:hypothetical protein
MKTLKTSPLSYPPPPPEKFTQNVTYTVSWALISTGSIVSVPEASKSAPSNEYEPLRGFVVVVSKVPAPP